MNLDNLIERDVSVGMTEERLKAFFEKNDFDFTFQDIETVFIPAENMPDDVSLSSLKGKYIGIYNEPVSEGFANVGYFRLHVLISVQGAVVYFRTEVVYVGA